jgi:hypothetical protein
LTKLFSDRQWARKFVGGKWEQFGVRWQPVLDWSDPKTNPEGYSLGVPEREEWG